MHVSDVENEMLPRLSGHLSHNAPDVGRCRDVLPRRLSVWLVAGPHSTIEVCWRLTADREPERHTDPYTVNTARV